MIFPGSPSADGGPDRFSSVLEREGAFGGLEDGLLRIVQTCSFCPGIVQAAVFFAGVNKMCIGFKWAVLGATGIPGVPGAYVLPEDVIVQVDFGTQCDVAAVEIQGQSSGPGKAADSGQGYGWGEGVRGLLYGVW